MLRARWLRERLLCRGGLTVGRNLCVRARLARPGLLGDALLGVDLSGWRVVMGLSARLGLGDLDLGKHTRRLSGLARRPCLRLLEGRTVGLGGTQLRGAWLSRRAGWCGPGVLRLWGVGFEARLVLHVEPSKRCGSS